MKLRKMTAIIAAAAMTLSTASLVSADIITPGTDPVNTEVSDETLNVGFASEPSCIWMAAGGITENEAGYIDAAIMDRLVQCDYTTGEVKPGLADSWEWVDDTHCRFHLRDDVIMTDGTPLVADDVVYTVGVWMECSPNTDAGRYVTGAVAEDEHTAVIELKSKAPDILSMFSWSPFGIVSEDEVEAAGGIEEAKNSPVLGCGKYVFKEWKRGQSITLERNENYWDPDWKGYYKEIVIHFTADPSAREMAVEAGDTDLCVNMPTLQAVNYGQSDSVNVVVYDYGQVAHLWYNMTEGHPTADIRVRQAIDKAINFEALAAVGTGGTAEASLGYLSPSSPYYNELYTAEERALDPEGAKALLEEAGYGDGLDITLIGLSDMMPAYTVLQENLRAVGINLNIETPDTAQYVQLAFAGEYDIILVGEYIPNRNPSAYTFVNQANIDGGHIIGGPKVTTPELDALVHEIIEEDDNAAALEKMCKLESILKEECIQSNLFPQMNAAIIAKDVKGFTLNERGYVNLTGFYK